MRHKHSSTIRTPRPPRRPHARRPRLERLERRALLASSPLSLAQSLHFNAHDFVQLPQRSLATPAEVDLYAVSLQAGETISAKVVAMSAGSGLASLLRVFDSAGTPLALDDQEGGDPHLTFQADSAGTYYLGVSSAPNNRYNPAVPGSGAKGGTTGLYELDVRLAHAALLRPDMAGSAFRTGRGMAASGDVIPVDFTVENRGGSDPGAFQVQVLLSRSNMFDGTSQVLATLRRSQLVPDANGRSFGSPGGFSVSLPPGLASGDAFLGLRIVADPAVPDAGRHDKSSVHRGTDWESLTLLTPAPAGASDLSKVDAGLRTLETGTTSGIYTFTVTADMGDGRITAEVAAQGGLRPRLTLSGPTGATLVQSDGGRLVQAVAPGTYFLTVTPQSGTGAGAFRLSTSFTAATPLLARLTTGTSPRDGAVADLTNDGILDLIVPNYNEGTMSLFMGNGDGTFQPPDVFPVPELPRFAAVADLNGDGILDIVVANYRNDSLGVLLGDGDGTFQPETKFSTGTGPYGLAVADVSGDGIPDIVAANYGDGTTSVFLGDGDGGFRPQQVYPVGERPSRVVTADLDGDGVLDVVTSNMASGDVSVLLGDGDGTFQAQKVTTDGGSSYHLAVADLNGDGKPDVVVNNYNDANTVSVLLGNGDGTFNAPMAYPAGSLPSKTALADFNRDGKLDLVVINTTRNSVNILLGRGDGTFQARREIPVGGYPGLFWLGDFNRDGSPDLVVSGVVSGIRGLGVFPGNGDGTFQTPPGAPPPASSPFVAYEAVADLNGDGRLDIVAANANEGSASVLLRNSDGTFQTRRTFPTGVPTNTVLVADVTGDGIPDIVATPYSGLNRVSILEGRGDGTFRPSRFIDAGNVPRAAAVADVDGDGKTDIVTTNYGDNTISVLLNIGDGTFQPEVTYPVGLTPYRVAVASLNGDGAPDLVVINRFGSSVSILLGRGDGAFQPQQEHAVGGRPAGLSVADLNGDGRIDVVTSEDEGVSVLLGKGDGTFQDPQTYPVKTAPRDLKSLAIGDVNGDGIPDLVVSSRASKSANVLLGNGDGTFQPPRTFPVDAGTQYSIEVADLNGDGKPDILTGYGNTISLLLGDGRGSFAPPDVLQPFPNFYAATVADVNGDGKPDLLQGSRRAGTVSVQLGTGSGTFTPGATLTVGGNPLAVASADLNRDGRLDVVATNSADDTVSVMLGNGDGTFQDQQAFAVGRNPRGVALADVNGDGVPDVTVANYDDDTVSVLLGKGDGSFRPQEVFPAGPKPYAVAVATLAGDGNPDIVVTDAAGDRVSVLLGSGSTGFSPAFSLPVGRQPFSLAVGDVNGDGLADVVVGNYADDTVSVLLGRANGTFRPQTTYRTGTHPSSVAIADVDGDGKPDLVAADAGDNASSVLLNAGDGTFRPPLPFATGEQPVQTLVTDVNGDGLPDFVTTSTATSATTVLLNLGSNAFTPASQANAVAVRSTPALVDLDGDGVPDGVVLDGAGDILFRKGLPGAGHLFAPPVVLNPGRPARDIAVVRTGTGLAVAAADARYDPALSARGFVFDISLYAVAPSGAIRRTVAFTTTTLPVRLSAADLTGDGLDSLVVASSLSDSVSIALQTAPGRFAAPMTMPVGGTPSALAAVDVNRDDMTDVVVADQSSGDVYVFLNDPEHTFRRTLRYAAGTEPSTIDAGSGVPSISSITTPVSLVAGDFLGTGRDDLAVVNRGVHAVNVLPSNGQGFGTATVAMSTSTSDPSSVNDQPGAAAAGDFNLDGKADLAVLMEDAGQVWIFSGHGDGTFEHTFTIPVGDGATGLALAPGGRAGLYDLLVGNRFGDVLILDGKGDGTFQISGKRVSISVVPNLLGPGQAGVLVGNQESSRVTIQTPTGGGGRYAPVSTLGGGPSSSQLAPGDVEWASLDGGSSLPDAVVVSTGSNAVVVYRTLSITDGAPDFAPPQTYFVGTAPAGVTIVDVSGDGVPDLVVSNQGSNDVSVVFGARDANGNWSGIAGPRLRAGGIGPVEVVARDLTGDGVRDLVAVNADSGTITLLPGVGRGFFNDQAARTLFDLGATLVQPPTFVGATGVGYAVTAAGALLRFDLGRPAEGASVAYAREPVVAAQALANGQVAVALASGAVNLLQPGGEGLVVASRLLARGGAAAAPSSINVVENAHGGFTVLVSSQGSDTLSVYGQVAAAPTPGATSTGGSGPSGSLSSSAQPTSAPAASSAITTVATAVSASQSSAASTALSSSSATTTTSATTAVVSNTSLYMGGFTSLVNGSSSGDGGAQLVGIEGNSYFSVPVLDFGSELDEEGASRMPGLSAEHPIGDASPWNQFVVGIDEALNDYLDAGEALLPGASDPMLDPWNADLFGIRRSVVSPVPLASPAPIAVPIDVGRNEQSEAGPGAAPVTPAGRTGTRLGALAGFASAFLLIPWLARTARAPRSMGTRRESSV